MRRYKSVLFKAFLTLFFTGCNILSSSPDTGPLNEQILALQKSNKSLKSRQEKLEKLLQEVYNQNQTTTRNLSNAAKSVIPGLELKVAYSPEKIKESSLPEDILTRLKEHVKDTYPFADKTLEKSFFNSLCEYLVRNAPGDIFEETRFMRAAVFPYKSDNYLLITNLFKKSIEYKTPFGNIPLKLTLENVSIDHDESESSFNQLEKVSVDPDKNIAIYKLPESLKSRVNNVNLGDITNSSDLSVYAVCGQALLSGKYYQGEIDGPSGLKEGLGQILASINIPSQGRESCIVLDSTGEAFLGIIYGPNESGGSYVVPVQQYTRLIDEYLKLKTEMEKSLNPSPDAIPGQSPNPPADASPDSAPNLPADASPDSALQTMRRYNNPAQTAARFNYKPQSKGLSNSLKIIKQPTRGRC